jgi:hypothetical protein
MQKLSELDFMSLPRARLSCHPFSIEHVHPAPQVLPAPSPLPLPSSRPLYGLTLVGLFYESIPTVISGWAMPMAAAALGESVSFSSQVGRKAT